jgi:hypothetical protein
LGGDLEPGTIDVGGDNTATIDDSYADSYIDNLTMAIEAKDVRIRELEEELVVSKRAARMLRGRK